MPRLSTLILILIPTFAHADPQAEAPPSGTPVAAAPTVLFFNTANPGTFLTTKSDSHTSTSRSMPSPLP